MNERPPSDPADHAEDFSRRYAEDLEIVAGQAMMNLGVRDNQMGSVIMLAVAKSTASFLVIGKAGPYHMPDKLRSIQG